MNRTIIATAAALLLACASAHAECPTRPDEANLTTHDCYVNRDHYDVHRPSETIDGSRPIGYRAVP